MKSRIAALTFLMIFSTGWPGYSHEKMEYVAEAVRIEASEAPAIDGRFDDTVWRKGIPISHFVQRDPLPGAPATEESEVYFLYDEENLYVGCRFYDAHPENIIRELRRREGIETSDRIELFFDTFHNHRTGYKFSMNPYGVQMDEQRFDDDGRNASWDAIWDSAAEIDSIGWVAEFKIPFFNMRFPDTEEQVWGFNLQREIRYKAERINWKPVALDDRSTSIRMSKLGHLAGIRGIRPGRKLELRPYGLSGFSESGGMRRLGKNETGLDFKYGITSDATLDATLNPDFAQIEADVLEINLTRFPTRFPEKREFFLEGREIFETPAELFYSRRIGARGDILWGTKLSGRARGGIEYGVVGSRTGDWNYFGLGEKDRGKEDAFFGVARMKKGFANGSGMGVMMTGKETTGGGYSRVFGVDGQLLYRGKYTTNIQIATSVNPGLTDDNNVYTIIFNRRANPWSGRLHLERVEPDFDINGTGFMAKELHRGYQQIRPVLIYSPLIEKMGIRQFTAFSSWIIGEDIFTDDYVADWRRRFAGTSIESRYTSGGLRPDYWTFDQAYTIRATNEMQGTFWYAVGSVNELTETFRQKVFGGNITTPKTGRIQKISGSLGGSTGTFYNFARKHVGDKWDINGSATAWLAGNFGLELNGTMTKTFDPQERMDGRHYYLSMRNTYLFSKDLFVRLFTQGRWGTTWYGEREVSNSYLLSFLLGWEYRPGSWFYLAFNEGREDRNDPHFRYRDFFLTDRTLVAKMYYAFHK